jgi:hypothetical protein
LHRIDHSQPNLGLRLGRQQSCVAFRHAHSTHVLDVWLTDQ